jgi:hypothetical protein
MQRGCTQLEPENESAAALLTRIIALYRASVVDQCEGAELLSRAAAKLDELQSPRRQTAGPTLSVRRFLARAPSNDCSGALTDVVEAFALAEPALAWVQNPNYTAQRMGPDFTDRYGYVELVGPQRIFESRTLLSGSCCWAAHSTPTTRTQLRRPITLYPACAVAMARGGPNRLEPSSITPRMCRMPCARKPSRCSRCTAGWETLRSRLIC